MTSLAWLLQRMLPESSYLSGYAETKMHNLCKLWKSSEEFISRESHQAEKNAGGFTSSSSLLLRHLLLLMYVLTICETHSFVRTVRIRSVNQETTERTKKEITWCLKHFREPVFKKEENTKNKHLGWTPLQAAEPLIVLMIMIAFQCIQDRRVLHH